MNEKSEVSSGRPAYILIQVPGFDFLAMRDLSAKINSFPVSTVLSRYYITATDKKLEYYTKKLSR